MAKSKKVYILLLVLLVLASWYFLSSGNGLSITGDGSSVFSQDCKFILSGNVCDSYTDCVYDIEGFSCINGYEIVTFSSVEVSDIVIGGGSIE